MKYYYLALILNVVAAFKVPAVINSEFDGPSEASGTTKDKVKSEFPDYIDDMTKAADSSTPHGEKGGRNLPSAPPCEQGEKFARLPIFVPRVLQEPEPLVFSPFDSIHQRMKDIHQRFMSNLFGSPFGPIITISNDSDTSFGSPGNSTNEPPFLFKLLDNLFGSFGGGSSNGSVLDMPSIHDLPANYSNTTSEIHQVGDAKVQVNQTIHKNSENGASDIFVFKVVNFLPPENATEGSETSQPESYKGIPGILDSKIDPSLNEIKNGFENNIEMKNMNEETQNELKELKRHARSVGIDISKAIAFPSNQLNRFPQSFANNVKVRPEDLKSLLSSPSSKSYVYKNIGGKPIFYIINHNQKLKESDSAKTPEKPNPDVEFVGPLAKPDLSRDTLVNPSGGDDEQQGLIQVDPDAELFDLGLLIKEIESRPKN